MAASKPVVNIDVVCDLTCPYCWIGKRRLMRSLKKLEDKAEFNIKAMAYQLRPEAPPEGMPIPSDYQKPDVLDKLRKMGKEVGIALNFTYSRWPNTAQCHCLLDLVRSRDGGDRQVEVAEIIQKTHFTDGTFLSEDEVVRIGQRVGLDPEEVRACIQNKDNIDTVCKESQFNKGRVTGMIPVYFFNGEEMVVGAQSEEVFLEKLNEAIAKAAATQNNA